jgi:hypothetical protein
MVSRGVSPVSYSRIGPRAGKFFRWDVIAFIAVTQN